jgi:uncharacterized protein (TIGR02284 family)
MTHSILEHVKSLHTASIDARNGYEEARHDAHGAGMAPLFQEMIALHTKNADDLSHILQRSGALPDEHGSFMSQVNRTVIGVRSLFGGLGKSVLPGLIDGETRNLSHYNDVLTETNIPADVHGVLLKNRERIADAIAEMKAVKS